LRFLTYTNLFIAFCAAFATWQTFIIIQKPINLNLIAISFFGTLATYNFQRLIKISKYQKFENSRRTWVLNNKKTIWAITFISFLLSIVFFIKIISLKIIAFLFIGLLMAIFYAVKPGFGLNRLRDIPFAKTFFVGLVWSIISAGMPCVFYDLNYQKTALIMIQQFLFITAITIPFDIRDIEMDKMHGVRTFATHFGEKVSVYISTTFLLLSFLIDFLLFKNFDLVAKLFIGLLISGFVAIVFIFKTKKTNHEYFWSLGLDGTIMFQTLLLYFFKHL